MIPIILINDVVDPLIGFTADINKEIAIVDQNDIIDARLETVGIDSVLQEKGNIDGVVSGGDMFDPVVNRENRCDNGEGIVVFCRFFLVRAAGADQDEYA